MKQLAWRIRYVRIAYFDGMSLTNAIYLSKWDWQSYGKYGSSPQERWIHYK